MSPRLPSNSPNPLRSASAPYNRRPSGQPKSSRQQFSACGACRMRRVRCDLKDIAVPVAGPHPACSNCKERGLKCVDEFADVKAVKLLRRGRRLQQVEAIYGKAADQNASSSSYLNLPTRLPSTIPPLQPEFFDSPFWHWFSLQRPLLDPAEFPARVQAHVKGSRSLGNEGNLLAMILVVWAASFGIDERGVALDSTSGSIGSLVNSNGASRPGARKGSNPSGNINHSGSRSTHESNLKNGQRDSALGEATNPRRVTKEKTEAMLREVFELVDIHAIMRRPTLDGVRVLLLLLPLLEDVHPLERLTMHEASLSQAYSLCTFLSGPPSSLSEEDAVIRARIFWYGHLQEGITTGMRGGRFILSEADLENFQRTLTPFHVNVSGVDYTTASGIPSPTSPTFSESSPPNSFQRVPHSSSVHPYLQMSHLFSVPLHLSSVCRRVHNVLTGAGAARRAEQGGGIDGEGMREIWDGLERCWEEFEAVRRDASGIGGEVDVQVDRFVSGWQIFIFECHNVIRESLKSYSSRPNSPISTPPHSPRPYLPPHHLYDIASRKCYRLLPCVLSIIKHHLTTPYDMVDPAGLFKWDAGLVRDGCFFAAFLSASIDSEQLVDYATCEPPILGTGRTQFKQESSDRGVIGLGGVGVDIIRPGLMPILDADEGTSICLTAISEMRWLLAKSEEREEAIRSIWENNKMKRQQQHQQPHFSASVGGGQHDMPNLPDLEMRYSQHTQAYEAPARHPVLPPLSLASPSHTMSMSAPTTACSVDGSGANGWPSYTPPGTANSATSTGTGISSGGSPVFAATMAAAYKGDLGDPIYPIVDAHLDQLAFSSPGSAVNDPNSVTVVYHQQQRNTSTHSLHGPSAGGGTHGGSGYLDFNNVARGSSIMVHSDDGCSQYSGECNGFYH